MHTLSSLVLWSSQLWHSAVWSVVTNISQLPATFTYTLQTKAAQTPDMLLTTYLNSEHHNLTPSQLHFLYTLPWTLDPHFIDNCHMQWFLYRGSWHCMTGKRLLTQTAFIVKCNLVNEDNSNTLLYKCRKQPTQWCTAMFHMNINLSYPLWKRPNL